MYHCMSFRVFLIPFKNFCTKNPMNHRMILYLLPKHQFSSSNSFQPLISENLQFPKNVQHIANQSVDEILSAVKSESMPSKETVSVLKALRMLTIFKNVNAESFKTDKRFKILCNVFERNCNIMHPNLLVSGLRSLLEIGVPANSSCVTFAEQSIMNNINLFSTFNIVGCLYFHCKFMETDMQKQVVFLLMDELCARISDIKSNAEVLMLVHFLHVFSEDALEQIQQKIIELIPTLNVHEICKIFNILAENSNRNILILNALSFHLRQREEILEIKEIQDILYSFKKLNFYDQLLISKVLDKVASEIPSVTQPSIISGILTSCGHLKLKHPGVLISSADWIFNHIEICRPKEFVSFILTIATLNFTNSETLKTLQKILPLLNYEKIKHSNIWLDVVWSLAVLNIVDKEMLLQVLSSDFYKPLIENSDFQTATNKLKMMNLKAVLKCYYPECIFRCDLFLEPVEISQSTEIQNNRRHVLKVLSNFIPKDKCLSTNQNTDMGLFIDAEFIMTKDLKPLSLLEYGILSKVSDAKILPKGAQRIALLILFFKDFTLLQNARTGFIDFAAKLLLAEGYTPVLIPFNEFMRNSTEVKKAKYLLQKISSTMQRLEDNNYKYHAKLFN